MLTDGPADRDDLRLRDQPLRHQARSGSGEGVGVPRRRRAREVTEDVIDADFADDGDDEFDHWISRRPFPCPFGGSGMTDLINRTKLVALMERILARIEADPDISASWSPATASALDEVKSAIPQTGARR